VSPTASLDHVARPVLPWRDEVLTECGLPEEPDRRIITRDAFRAKVSREGQQRSAMTTCMTCWHTAQRWEDWTMCPADAMRRELMNFKGRTKNDRLNAELRAIAALIAAHRDEFDAYLAGLADTTDLSVIRQARRMRVVKRQGAL
jgi:hypothetical protein